MNSTPAARVRKANLSARSAAVNRSIRLSTGSCSFLTGIRAGLAPMKVAVCIENYSRIHPGVQADGTVRKRTTMFKQKWILGVVALDGIAIVALAVYLFLNFSTLNLTKGIVLLVIAGIIMLSVIVMMIYLTRSLAKKKQDKNTPQ
jgi:hypothetical protein